jgi:two-component system, chemotaxis family, protein-glutamate methylesterase/glutaminase
VLQSIYDHASEPTLKSMHASTLANVSGAAPNEHIPGAASFVVGIAASSGGLHAIGQVLGGLPTSLSAAIIVVQHLAPKHHSFLAHILDERTALRVHDACEGAALFDGSVYVAPPDLHTVVDASERIRLIEFKPVNFVRPSADVLFQSLADNLGTRAIGVVLTGNGMDGATGLLSIKNAGGFTIAEHVMTAEFPDMPRAAVEKGGVDRTLPLDQIAESIYEHTRKAEHRAGY